MSKAFALITLAFALFGHGKALALNVLPTMIATGQGLTISCDPKTESLCKELCNNPSLCKVQESYCRSCAGTSDLKLKRILDSVGNTLIADKVKPKSELSRVLKSAQWVTIHPATLYNYSGAFDSEQLRTQFRALCVNKPQGWEVPGLLLLSLNQDHRVESTLGALCPSLDTGSYEYMSLTRKWTK